MDLPSTTTSKFSWPINFSYTYQFHICSNMFIYQVPQNDLFRDPWVTWKTQHLEPCRANFYAHTSKWISFSSTWRVFVHPILSIRISASPTFLQSRRNSSCNSSFTALPDRKSVVFPGVLVLTARKLWSCWWPLVSLSNMGQQDVMDSCQWIFGPYRDL